MIFVAVSAFNNKAIRPFRRSGLLQQRRMGRAQVTAKHHTLALVSGNRITFNVSRTQNMPSRLKANGKRTARLRKHLMPLPIRHRHKPGTNQPEHPLNQCPVPGKTNLQGIFQDFRKHDRGRFRTDNRPLKPGRQQIRNAANVINVHVSDDQGTDMLKREINGEIGSTGTVTLFLALEQTAVNQNAGGSVWLRTEGKFVAGASDAGGGAVVGYVYHSQQSMLY